MNEDQTQKPMELEQPNKDEQRKDEAATTEQQTDKVVGVLAYLSLIGFIIAIILNASKKQEEKKFGAFHLRQSLGLLIVGILFLVINAVIKTLLLSFSLGLASSLYFVSSILSLIYLALLFLGVWNAINGNEKTLPIVGSYFSKLLKNTFE